MKQLIALVSTVALAGCTADVYSQITEYSFGSFVEITCNRAEFQRSQYEEFFSDLPEPKHTEIKQAMLGAEAKCGVLRPIYEGLKESYNELNSGVWLPRSRYIFKFSATPEDKRTVGLFETESACEEARDTVVSLGYEAEECRKRILFRHTIWA
jgi:hypothetical protein